MLKYNKKITALNTLIIFTRYPEPGKVKTRLIPSLGRFGAARLQREMTRHILAVAVSHPDKVKVELHYDGGDEAVMRALYGNDLSMRPQTGNGLGERMSQAFQSAFANGALRVALTGSDCPFITDAIISEAFEQLNSHDCVLGPAEDGGYYLIGLVKPAEVLFEPLPWGTDSVLKETLERAEKAGINYTLLKMLPDIDRPEDICLWKEVVHEAKPRIAAIIPACNEEASIVATLGRLKDGTNIDCIVVDGGSTDNTAGLAAGQGAVVVLSGAGRALQMNKGASMTSAGILLFLHADTFVPSGFDAAIRNALADPAVVAGAFSLEFDSGRAGLKAVAFGANLRSRFLKLPYGDQGLFMWASDFHSAGCFPDIPIMEDIVFVRAIKKYGRIVTLPQKVTTSARRYSQMGILRTWIINQLAIFNFALGSKPEELCALYRSQSGIRKWVKHTWNLIKKKCFLSNIPVNYENNK
ncbi:MAG: TIGR04283 family arsenosugar biosynthesis glycosyltransferase [Spirochaetota bacterium]